MTRALALLAAACLCLLSAADPGPSRLQDIVITDGESFVEVSLQLPQPPQPVVTLNTVAVTITLPDCLNGLSREAAEALASLGHKLVRALQIREPLLGQLEVCISLSTSIRPFISRSSSGITLRFYRQEDSVITLAGGVSLRIMEHAGRESNLTVHELRLDRQATRGLAAVSALGLGQTLLRPSEIAQRAQADVVINGGFFSKTGEHLSTFVEAGNLVAPGVYPTRPMLAVDRTGRAHIGRFEIDDPQAEEECCCCVNSDTRFEVFSAIGAGPMLVEKGRRMISIEQDLIKPDIATGQRARTGVGVTRKGEVVFVVVREDEAATHPGVSLQELADLLIDAGAHTAMNLDGGGSSAIVVAGDLLLPDGTAERPVSNAWVLRLAPGESTAVASSVDSEAGSVAVELNPPQSQSQ